MAATDEERFTLLRPADIAVGVVDDPDRHLLAVEIDLLGGGPLGAVVCDGCVDPLSGGNRVHGFDDPGAGDPGDAQSEKSGAVEVKRNPEGRRPAA